MENINFEMLLRHLEEGVMVANPKGELIYANRRVKEILGIGLTEAGQDQWSAQYGLYLPDKKTPFPTKKLPMSIALTGKSCQDIIMYARNPNLSKGIYLRVSANPLFDENRQVIAGVVIFNDDTRRVKNEEKIKRSNKRLKALNQIKNEFMGMASHDIRNPMGIIKGYAELMEDGHLSTAKEIKSTAGQIKHAADRLLDLIENLLSFNAIEQKKLSIERHVVDFKAKLEEIVAFYQLHARKKDITLTLHVPKRCHLVIDAQKVSQVIENFLSNAIKFTPKQGSVNVRCLIEGHDIRLDVQDSGPGIPAAEHNMIFKPFQKASVAATAGEKGSGLGLAICKKMIDAMGGSIELKSSTKGSTFYFKLTHCVRKNA